MDDTIRINTSFGEVAVAERKFAHHTSRRSFNAKARIYVSNDDPFNVIEDLENRRRRPYKVWRKSVIAAIAESGLDIDTKGMGWDQRAGCGCGCSPGFVLDNFAVLRYGDRTLVNYDVWVTLKGAPAVDETKPARELVLA